MEVQLTIYSDEKEHFSQHVELPCVIGRGKYCDVTIVHHLISRKHCEIYEEEGRVRARDLGSLNGTFLNDVGIGQGETLRSGSVLEIGRLRLKIEFPEASGDTTESEGTEDSIELVDELVSEAPEIQALVSGQGDSAVIDLNAFIEQHKK